MSFCPRRFSIMTQLNRCVPGFLSPRFLGVLLPVKSQQVRCLSQAVFRTDSSPRPVHSLRSTCALYQQLGSVRRVSQAGSGSGSGSGWYESVADSAPVHFTEQLLISSQQMTALPWWAGIICTTLALRTVITLPLAVYQAAIIAKIEALQKEIAELALRLRYEISVRAKEKNWSEKTCRYHFKKNLRRIVSELYVRENCHPFKATLLVWVLDDNKKSQLLPGDQDNLAIQMRGGPEKHEVTGWVLIFPLTKNNAGTYECHASNPNGEASATGTIHVVDSLDEVPSEKAALNSELQVLDDSKKSQLLHGETKSIAQSRSFPAVTGETVSMETVSINYHADIKL
ncbi:Mitochondrial inner membrane protein COX18 [Bagarius yarrelli]|uniref:Mitochondrial inner membrane protein COX18 n=1 Tax=Bagarius yarrelli TaxID=175774 RepID=A0A556VC03_BAGYA|nr:Mitochondrial inner membrane protein COX18 [Bagarius yarrelli]